MKKLLIAIKSKIALLYWELLLLSFVLISSYLEPVVASGINDYFSLPLVYVYYVVPLVLSIFSFLVLLIFFLRNEKEGVINFKYLLGRLRLKKIAAKGFGISLLLFLFTLISIGISRVVLIEVFGFQDSTSLSPAPEGISKQDIDYVVISIFVLGILMGTFLEELFWRGYLLPLQERKTGKFGAYFNGVLWSISHIFVYNPAIIIVSSFGFSYVAYKTKNTSIKLIAHLLMNSLVLIRLVFHYI